VETVARSVETLAAQYPDHVKVVVERHVEPERGAG
jgi:uncharacterized protein YsxB (DUF464 family)